MSWIERRKAYLKIAEEVESFLKQDTYSVSIEDLLNVLVIASGPQRGPAMEKFFVDSGYYSSKVPAKKGRGDLTNGILYDELKVRFLSDADIKRGKLHSAGQIRLWEKVDNYLMVTVNKDTLEYFIYYIPKADYRELVLSRTVRFSSSHIKGNSQLLRENPEMVDRLEISSEFNAKDYDWNKYLISLEELKKRVAS